MLASEEFESWYPTNEWSFGQEAQNFLVGAEILEWWEASLLLIGTNGRDHVLSMYAIVVRLRISDVIGRGFVIWKYEVGIKGRD